MAEDKLVNNQLSENFYYLNNELYCENTLVQLIEVSLSILLTCSFEMRNNLFDYMSI